jgi:peptide/nickel transport system substrate-binding protein
MSNRLFAALSGLMIVSMLLSACAPAATPVPPTAPPAVPATAQPTQPPLPTNTPVPTKPPAPTATPKPKVARVTFQQEPDSLNPLYSQMWFVYVAHGLFLTTGLLTFNEKNEPIPWIAKEIPSKANGGISADDKVITYKLREDAKWSDGEPLTADDYVFTWQMIMSDKNAVMSRDPYDTYVDKVEAKDKYTLVVTFKEPYAPWQAKIFSPVNATQAIPKHILEPVFQKDGTIDNADWNRNPTVGAGPFVFKEWQSGSHLIFQANPNFWLGKPKLDQVFIKIVPDDAAQLAAMKAGDTDFGVFISYQDMPDIEKMGTFNLVVAQSGYQESWFMNLSTDPKTKGHPALQDVNVRKAIVMAVDRDKIIQDLLGGRTKVSATFWEGTPYADPNAKALPYDPEGAKKLLDDAGWKVGADGIRAKGGVKLKLRYATTTKDVRKNTQVLVQQMLKDVGVDVELINISSDVFFAGYAEKGPIALGQYDIEEHSTVGAFPDPDAVFWLCKEIPSDANPSGTNNQFLCDKDLDALFAKEATTVDPAARVPIFFQISQIINDKVYWNSMWNDPDWWAVSKNMVNVKISGATMFWNSYEWDMQ